MGTILLGLPFKNWPAADQDLWKAALHRSDFFDEDGAFANSSAGSLRVFQQGYGHWLSFLARTSPEALKEAPGSRVSQARVEAYIAESHERGLRLRTIATQLMSLRSVLHAFNCPENDWLKQAERRIYRASNPTQLKKPFAIKAATLFNWSLQRLAMLEETPFADPIQQAVAWRQALMVGIQVACPVRLRAMVAMTVEWHVLQTGGSILLRWAAQDMKDKRRREMPLPQGLVGPFRRYLDHWRPVLLKGSNSDALWVSQRGVPLNADSYQGGLAKLTEREFAITLRPHAFRHIAATCIAERNPVDAGIIRDVLGHATIRTSEMYYNRAEAKAVTAQLQELLDKRRQSATVKPSRKSLRKVGKPLSIDRKET